MNQYKATTWLIVILLFCFFARIAYVILLGARMDSLVVADMCTYDLLARNLIEKGYYGIEGVFRSYRPPLYPFFLSLVYRALGHSYILARVVQAGLASLSCLIVFLIARDLCGPRVGLLATFFTAADFSLIHLSGLFLSENLYIPLSLLLILFLMDGFKNPKVFTFVGAGVIGGLAALCRPMVLLFLVVVVLVPVFQKIAADFPARDPAQGGVPTGRGSLRSTRTLKGAATGFQGKVNNNRIGGGLIGWAVMMAMAALTICPWTIRNYRIHRAFVPVSTNAGTMLWMGLHPGASGGYDWPEENNPLEKIKDEVERDRLGRSESLRFIIGNPGEFFKLAALKMKIFWRGYLFTWSGRQWALIGLASLGGLLLSLRNWRKWLLLYLYLVTFTGIHLFVHSSYRYRLPLNPLMEIWAALFLVQLGELIKRSIRPKKSI